MGLSLAPAEIPAPLDWRKCEMLAQARKRRGNRAYLDEEGYDVGQHEETRYAARRHEQMLLFFEMNHESPEENIFSGNESAWLSSFTFSDNRILGL